MSTIVPQLDDPYMMKLAIRGDNHALATLLRDNYAVLYRYLLKVTMNKGMAEDLAQDTMLRAMERIKTFGQKSKFSTWLISIATRLYMDEMRKVQREKKWQAQEQAMHAIRFDAAMRQEEWPDALDALEALPYGVRVPILLKHYYGFEYEEIAKWLDIPIGTVKSRLHNGLKQLRKELSDDEQ
ncbi:RNA polymerase sigma factor SigY [Paenibacillus baekrokdamisoli]|uniref:RNA polymerase sigma factor n=1 Tax=Paenibacillus baekrokdamisoli TaxID=1712516 RepID=A0A3G9J1P1_9BACL|nr:RNA polymerase sigma factor SigY [Paenibacillus baekrokdamisoli]MBB3071288.1 RNA polymerase sigma-70 factor (ECF subfamily) [Paenibacillus baekrokdamisoli]BBH24676.1 RNA polymerase sigma factor SigY [Paenibacillus baekrokdamisoli]